jgi:polar amino acid transport system substrate-binding protein/glutamate/aspartate transport system substrate-binding protein
MVAVGRAVCATILAAGMLHADVVVAGTLDDIRGSGTVRLAYREDAPPFSYVAGNGAAPAGFIVDLCRAVAAGIGRQLGIDIKEAYVPVTATDRFAAITNNKADLLCEATTQTLKRRETVSFSIPTFADGASFIIRPGGPEDIGSLADKKVGVLAGTTTEAELRRALAAEHLNAEIVPAKTHREGLDAVEKGAVAAYFADRGILAFLLMNAKTPTNLLLADIYLTVEPYALAMRRGDEEFRLAVDRELSSIYRSGQIARIFGATFGPSVRPSPTLLGLYTTAALPE